MLERYKKHFKLNIMSLVFLAISFISITFAWFAYSSTVRTRMDVFVRTWNIEMSKDGETVSHQVIISLDEIFPGMDTVSETINVKNLGDSDANLRYEIDSVKILGNTDNHFDVQEDGIDTKFLEDKISHDYPFKINMAINNEHPEAKGGESSFNISVSWPLDSGDDETDSYWGQESFKFQTEEKNKKNNDSNYSIKPSVRVVLNLRAEQRLDDNNDNNDSNFGFGEMILFNPFENKKCETISETCYKGLILDTKNLVKDSTVRILLDPSKTLATSTFTNLNTEYDTLTSSWDVNNKLLDTKNILYPLSKDIVNTKVVTEDLSDRILGSFVYEDRLLNTITKLKTDKSNVRFSNEEFEFLSTNNCYWINESITDTKAYAVKKIDESFSNIYLENKTTSCRVVPIIIVDKYKLK